MFKISNLFKKLFRKHTINEYESLRKRINNLYQYEFRFRYAYIQHMVSNPNSFIYAECNYVTFKVILTDNPLEDTSEYSFHILDDRFLYILKYIVNRLQYVVYPERMKDTKEFKDCVFQNIGEGAYTKHIRVHQIHDPKLEVHENSNEYVYFTVSYLEMKDNFPPIIPNIYSFKQP